MFLSQSLFFDLTKIKETESDEDEAEDDEKRAGSKL
jgi:hypothetical protein